MSDVNRRAFMKGSAATLAVAASANAAGAVEGANDTLRVGFIGVGGRCQAHVKQVIERTEKKQKVQGVAVCDVFSEYLKRTAKQIDKANNAAGIKEKVAQYADYRKLLDDKNIDIVVVCTPDHWHAKQTIDALNAGKDVYCEKPMTHTIDEAYAVVEAAKRNNRVMQVGVQSTSDPQYRDANAKIASGRIGKVLQGQTHYYRNSTIGMWRNYPLARDMNPKNIDWDMFLGHEFGLAPKVPFDRARYKQWRCYWDYGGGMYTDLFVHRCTRLMIAMGLREPRRVVGGGGIFLEYDGRDVPDVATVVADFDEGCQLLCTSSMANSHGIEEVVRGHTGTILFQGGGKYEIRDQSITDGKHPTVYEADAPIKVEQVQSEVKFESEDKAHWDNFIACVRERKRETNCPPELGASVIAVVNMGMASYREGRALFFDKETRKVVNADSSWAKQWEQKSYAGGPRTNVMGWTGGDKGSLLEAYPTQNLAGPWINGQDPAEKTQAKS